MPVTISESEREGLLTIDLRALVENYRWLRAHLQGGGECSAVVKADAYGLGVARVAPALFAAGCRTFFVATQPEGEALRNLLPAEAIIYVLTGVRPGCEASCARAGLIPVLVTTAQIQHWCDQTLGMGGDESLAAPAALKVDSGMTRLGMGAKEFAGLIQQPALLRRANLQLILTHLACADEAGHAQNSRQLTAFSEMVDRLRQVCPGVRASLANSAGICLGEAFHFDLVRPGSALYGVNPTPTQPNPMRPVVNLRLPVLQLRQVIEDSAVGYGATQTAVAGSWLAVVRGGYADGLLRAQSGRGRGVAIAGTDRIPVPMLGRVSMDTTVFDVSALNGRQREQLGLIEVLGPTFTVDTMGAAAGTIGYEILTSLGHRYYRQYV
ncbi:alanine racemase [uncultured Microbulbifer sp.]|uniref:alanine racemase n=1 Tax=uncultured Microbulbifer sp. TaxID=348147 RepID=UPI0026255A5B|nr:alanine racemase [uncultured Microbulbifer sp.]